ncbi:LysR family transcriptional regulator [Radicibacter daui]|uniref:LysR family transcriptional regulator n=1 Tax=Radicibacter daui TaxID=3064829 RepID=UPI004046A108
MDRPTLNDLSAFAAIARHRSFRKAADELGISRSALSHTLIGLERTLGVRLLNRTTRSVAATEAGAALLDRVSPLLRELDVALDLVALEQKQPAGALRISASKGAARVLLDLVVPQFLELYPAVELDIASDGRFVDIVEEGFDAGVRLLEAVPQDMIAVRFGGDMRFVALAAPSYLARHPAPEVPDDLKQHRCIRQRLPSGKRYRWEFARRGLEMAVEVSGPLTLDDNDLMLAAAADGLGIAYVPERMAEGYLMSGRLVRVLDEWCPAIPGLALYYPGHRHVPSALRAFIDMLRPERRG